MYSKLVGRLVREKGCTKDTKVDLIRMELLPLGQAPMTETSSGHNMVCVHSPRSWRLLVSNSVIIFQ